MDGATERPMQLSLSSHYQVGEEESVIPPGTATPVMNAAQFTQQYEICDELLGYGRASVVKVARRRDSGALFACKIIPKHTIRVVERLHHEIRVLEAVRGHPGLATLDALCETEREIVLLTSLATGGDLYECIVRRKFSEDETRQVIYRLLAAVGHLHAQNIIHRDIKPENVLLASKDNYTHVMLTDFGVAKICDDQGMAFGSNQAESATDNIGASIDDSSSSSTSNDRTVSPFSKFSSGSVNNNQSSGAGAAADSEMQDSFESSPRSPSSPSRVRAYTSIGTDNYIAPEILRGGGYGVAVDVWSIGVVAYLMLGGMLPFASAQNMLSSEQVSFPPLLFGGVSEQAQNLVLCLLNHNPEARLTCVDALRHSWFSGTVFQHHQDPPKHPQSQQL